MAAPSDIKNRKHMFSDDMKFLQKAVVFHPDGDKFLAVRRHPKAPSRPKAWDLPGGNVGFGENHLDSLKREISEETSLVVDGLRPIQVVTEFVDEIYYLYIGFACTTTSTKVQLSIEHTEYKWVTTEEFLSLESADFLVDTVKQLG